MQITYDTNKEDQQYKDNYRQNRSTKYQYLILEETFDVTFLENFDNSCSIEGHLNPFKYNENLLELEDKLRELTFNLINKILTKRQLEIYQLTIDGYKQSDIAKKLKINQSSVTKCLNGNKDYKNGICKNYGGIIRKVKNAIKDNVEINQILNEINELKTERY